VRAGSKRRVDANLIAGLIPRAAGVTDPDMARALDDRADAMQCRARELAIHAVEQGQAWVSGLGVPPRDEVKRERWLEAVSVVVANWDRWNVGNDRRPTGLDSTSKTIEEARHRERAELAVVRACQVSSPDRDLRKLQLAAEPAAVSHELSTSVDL
jgi:hypothetical protein